MESNYNNRDFEQFVKQNADQYRMFPSEKVWKGIHGILHTRKRWYGIGLALLLLLTSGTVTWVMINPSSGTRQTASSDTPAVSGNNTNSPGAKSQPVNTFDLSPRSFDNHSPLTTGNLRKEDVFSFGVPGTLNAGDKSEAIRVIAEPGFPDAIAGIQNNKILPTEPFKAPGNTQFSSQPLDDNPDFSWSSKIIPEPAAKVRNTESYPQSIESVVNSFNPNPGKNRLSFQLYFTPTVSYRKLHENKSYLNSASAINNPSQFGLASLTDINSVVTHKPDLGFELGISTGYKINKDLKFKAGVQFNVSRYDIKAFTYNGEIATIALNSGNDLVSVGSNYRNRNGYGASWLQNLYFSISAPVGAELMLGDNGKTSLGIAGSLQPTYVLGDRAYLISTDYKNYVKVPWLIRRWNLNTSVETFVSYSTGKLKWQVGPQIRYQMLSSFKQKYPVRENLFDFGLRVGIMLNH